MTRSHIRPEDRGSTIGHFGTLHPIQQHDVHQNHLGEVGRQRTTSHPRVPGRVHPGKPMISVNESHFTANVSLKFANQEIK